VSRRFEWEGRYVMRNFFKSRKAAVVTRVLASATGLTAVVAVLAAGRKW
jgi:hypothetical protein